MTRKFITKTRTLLKKNTTRFTLERKPRDGLLRKNQHVWAAEPHCARGPQCLTSPRGKETQSMKAWWLTHKLSSHCGRLKDDSPKLSKSSALGPVTQGGLMKKGEVLYGKFWSP